MDFWRALKERQSIRSFDPTRHVAPEVVSRLLEAAIRAPSAGNRQPWHFIVVRDRLVRKALAEAAYGQEFVHEAPVVIAVCADAARSASRYGDRGANLYCLQDTAAAIEHILLAGTALGLGTCWVGAFDEASAARALDTAPGLRPIALVPVGYAGSPPPPPPARRPIDEVVSYR